MKQIFLWHPIWGRSLNLKKSQLSIRDSMMYLTTISGQMQLFLTPLTRNSVSIGHLWMIKKFRKNDFITVNCSKSGHHIKWTLDGCVCTWSRWILIYNYYKQKNAFKVDNFAPIVSNFYDLDALITNRNARRQFWLFYSTNSNFSNVSRN